MFFLFSSLGLSLTTLFPLIFTLCFNPLVQAQDQDTGDASDSSPDDQHDLNETDTPITTATETVHGEDNSDDDPSSTPTTALDSTSTADPTADPTETPTESPLTSTTTSTITTESPIDESNIEATESTESTSYFETPTMTSDPFPTSNDLGPTSIMMTPLTSSLQSLPPTTSIQVTTSSNSSVSSPSSNSDQNGGLSSTQTSIIGGVIGGVAGLALLGAIVMWTVRRTKKQREAVDFEAFNPQLEYDDHMDAAGTSGGRAARWSKVQTSMSQPLPYEADDDRYYHRY